VQLATLEFNTVHIPCIYIAYMDVCVTNLLHDFIFVVFASSCFGLESRPSSGSYEPFWQLIYTCVYIYIYIYIYISCQIRCVRRTGS
jgi:hypothetical protein